MVSMVTQSTDINTGEFIVGLTGHCAIFPPPPPSHYRFFDVYDRKSGWGGGSVDFSNFDTSFPHNNRSFQSLWSCSLLCVTSDVGVSFLLFVKPSSRCQCVQGKVSAKYVHVLPKHHIMIVEHTARTHCSNC